MSIECYIALIGAATLVISLLLFALLAKDDGPLEDDRSDWNER